MFFHLTILCFVCLISGILCDFTQQPKLCNNGTCVCLESGNNLLPELSLDCRGFDYKIIPEDNYTFITSIDFSENNLKELTNTPLSSPFLKVIKLSFNSIGFMSSKYFALTPNLKELYLDHNRLTSIDEYSFYGLSNLKTLDLSYNRIMELSTNTFNSLPSLVTLNLGYNNEIINYVFEMADNNNNQGFFKAFFGGENVTNLRELNLDGFGFKQNLPDYFFNDAPSTLKTLSLANNDLTEVPVIPNSVEILDLSGNDIRKLMAMDLAQYSLRVLKMERMKNLTTIDKYAFYNLQKLEHLSLALNPSLEDFTPIAFGILVDDVEYNLKTLSLKGCHLQKLHSNYSTLFNRLESVDLSYNPWKCDCDLDWIKNHKKILVDADNIRCETPSGFLEKQFTSTEKLECGSSNDSSGNLQKILLPILSVCIIAIVGIIAYLIYMGPFNYKGNGIIGKGSPYSNVLVNERD